MPSRSTAPAHSRNAGQGAAPPLTAAAAATAEPTAASTYAAGLSAPKNLVFSASWGSAGLVQGTVGCPDSLDWRVLGGVTAVKDQGACGASWAFAPAAALEGAHFAATGKLVDVSVAQLVDCTYPGWNPCAGGWPADAYAKAEELGCVAGAGGYPYNPKNRTGLCEFKPERAEVLVDGYTEDITTEADMLKVVCNQLVVVAVYASYAFITYKSGVFTGPCEPANSPGGMWLVVTFVGYGTENTTGLPYWLVKNSLGTGWGDKGYMKLVRGRAACGILEFEVTFPTVTGVPPPNDPGVRPPADPPLPTNASCPPTYKAQSSDTAAKIAAKFNVDVLASSPPTSRRSKTPTPSSPARPSRSRARRSCRRRSTSRRRASAAGRGPTEPLRATSLVASLLHST